MEIQLRNFFLEIFEANFRYFFEILDQIHLFYKNF